MNIVKAKSGFLTDFLIFFWFLPGFFELFPACLDPGGFF
jgi:hypothetical protein